MTQPYPIFREESESNIVPDFPAPISQTKPLRAAAPVVHFNHLDGIRALAASYVVLNHILEAKIKLSPALHWMIFPYGFGHFAVNVFIVLSGYCLMLPVARTHATSLKNGTVDYLRRRALRILPPYFAALLVAIVVLIATQHTKELTKTNIISHLFLVHNLGNLAIYSINPPLWSVAVEWQIYFFFPLLLLPMRRMLGNYACVAIAYVIGMIPHLVLPVPQNFEWTCPWYLSLFAIGMVVADMTYQPSVDRGSFRRRGLGIFSIILFAIVAKAICTDSWLFHHDYLIDPIMGLSAACFLAWAGQYCTNPDEGTPFVLRLLSARPLVLVGTFSYSLYLIHEPVLWAMEPIIKHLHLAGALELAVRLSIGFPVAIAAAYLFYLAVEKPSMELRARKPNQMPISRTIRPTDRKPLSIFVQRASDCLTDYLPHGDGLICFSLLGGLARRGHRIFAYTRRDEVQARPETMVIKSHLHRIPANGLADYEHNFVAAHWLRQLEKNQRIDLVWRMLPQGESCPTVPYTGGRPLVIGQLFYSWPAESVMPHDGGKPRFGFGVRVLLSPLARRGWAKTLRRASLVLCGTEALSQQMQKQTSGNITTLPVIVDPPTNLVANRPRPLSPSSLKLLFVANLVTNKNPQIFCQTIHRLRQMGVDATGNILGEGAEQGALEAWCKDNGVLDSIHFLGRVSNLEVYRHLSEADGLISSSFGEPYGRSIVEAMSVSAVPICHRSGGPADIISNQVDGLLIDRLDSGDYADAIFKAWSEPGAWQRLSSNALEKSQQWKPSVVIDRLENALYSVLERGSSV